ncbi:MAG: hypothetical protein PHQ62_02185 [Clostridia bacterium]|nr:hypothetical protein [Clostridia bacterium]
MKKFKILAIIFAVAIIFCSCKFDIQGEVLDNISDVRYNLFEAKTENLTATLMCGMRESPYAYDGVSNSKCEFGIITITYKVRPETEAIPYTLRVGSAVFEGNLEENPFDHTYMVDIEKIVDNTASICLKLENFDSELQMACISSNWAVQYDNALTIAMQGVEDDLLQFFSSKKFLAECYLKIIFDQKSTTSPYFWYFGIIGENGTTVALIIDTETGEILTKSN